MSKTNSAKENFTAILPVTCNADCGFCPEKEMENKAPKDMWIDNLVSAINKTYHQGYDHISLSGGEPTLDPRLLEETIYSIMTKTPIKHIGLTTNGQFMESQAKLNSFLKATTGDSGNFLPYFINISRHAFDTAENNEIMGVNYKHTISDVIHLRNILPSHVSFRLNMVLTSKTDIRRLFEQAKLLAPVLRQHRIDIAFRTDYSLIVDHESGLVPKEIRDIFECVFGESKVNYSCPTCVTYVPLDYHHIFLKGADFEPTEKEDLQREFIFHQDGKLYNDWKRNKPVSFDNEIALEKLLGVSLLMSSSDAEVQKRIIFSTYVNPTRNNANRRSATPSCGSSGCGSSSGSCGGSGSC